jgi:hypothetical protein
MAAKAGSTHVGGDAINFILSGCILFFHVSSCCCVVTQIPRFRATTGMSNCLLLICCYFLLHALKFLLSTDQVRLYVDEESSVQLSYYQRRLFSFLWNCFYHSSLTVWRDLSLLVGFHDSEMQKGTPIFRSQMGNPICIQLDRLTKVYFQVSNCLMLL